MSLDKEEKERLAQLGLDRRLAEAVGALEVEAGTFLRVAGEENAEEEAVMQAASNYRAAVQRRNIAYDRACGVPEDQAGEADGPVAATLGVDPDDLAKMVDKAVTGKVPAEATIDEDALTDAVEAALAKHLPEAVKAEIAKSVAGPKGGGKATAKSDSDPGQ